MNDQDLLRELAPSGEQLLARHLATAKEWFPHEFVPWSRGRDFEADEPFDPDESPLPAGVRSALLLNLLTEDNLPHYYRAIVSHFGNDGVWGEWNRRWTAEEGRHAIVIRDYLTVSRSIDLRALERARMAQVSNGIVPNPPTISEGIAYVALQELATRISHRNTGKLLDDPAGEAVMSRVAADENLHHLFYRDLVAAALELDPSGTVIAIDQQVRFFEMPGAGVPDFAAHVKAIADVGVYDFTSHHDNILVPVVVKHWRLDQLTDLDAAGEEARDRVLNYIERVGRVAKRRGSRRPRTTASV